MLDEWLKRMAALRPLLELSAGMFAVLALLLFAGAPAPPPASHVPGVEFADAPLDPETALGQAWPQTSEHSIYALPRPQSTGWIRWNDVDLTGLEGPLAVRTAGPFSARLYWNGTLIGMKGVPGENAGAEQAGTIDAVIAIPPELIRAGNNRLEMEYSSHKAGYEPMTIIHALLVMPYRADARRPLRNYVPLILTGSGLVALAIALAYLGQARSDPRAYWLAAAMTAVFLAGGAEVSRAFINYPYDWHQPRQAVMFAMLVIAGTSLLRFAQKRWPAGPLAVRLFLGCGIAGAAASLLMMEGYDAKSVITICLFLLLLSGWMVWRARGPARFAGLWAGLIAVYGFYLPGDFLDRAIYALLLVWTGYLVLRQINLLLPLPDAPPARISLQTSKGLVLVDRAAITAVKAAGNYTEIYLSNGGQHLDNRSLRALLDVLPDTLYRLHRSHAVNLGHARRLSSTPGSRYNLEMSDGRNVPVSRDKVADLRERLAD